MIAFTRTNRARPMVLTRHQISELSAAAGYDVHDRLYAMRDERFDAVTLGALMRALRLILASGFARE